MSPQWKQSDPDLDYLAEALEEIAEGLREDEVAIDYLKGARDMGPGNPVKFTLEMDYMAAESRAKATNPVQFPEEVEDA